MTDLYAAIHTLNTYIGEATAQDQISRPGFYRRLLRVFCSVLRAATRMKRATDRAELKQAMLSDEEWRERLIYDFGGEPALARWDAKYEKSLHPNPGDRKKPVPRDDTRIRYDNRSTHPNVFYDRVKVDQQGQFRLAPIVRPKRDPSNANADSDPKTPLRAFVPKIKYTDIDPIPVYPDELRNGVQTPKAEHDHANAMAALQETADKATVQANAFMAKIPHAHSRGRDPNTTTMAEGLAASGSDIERAGNSRHHPVPT